MNKPFRVFDIDEQVEKWALYDRKIERYVVGLREYTEKQFGAKFEAINDKQIKLFESD